MKGLQKSKWKTTVQSKNKFKSHLKMITLRKYKIQLKDLLKMKGRRTLSKREITSTKNIGMNDTNPKILLTIGIVVTLS